MKHIEGKIAGAIIFVGAVQFVLCLIIAEALYPAYSISENYISDLGVGVSAPIFNSSVFVLGLVAVVSASFMRSFVQDKIFIFFLALCGIGAMGVGIFPENYGVIHTLVSLIAFLFGALSAIKSYKIQKPPSSYFAIVLGLISLAALVLFAVSEVSDKLAIGHAAYFYLGLGKGGMERIIAYPIILWAIGLGGYLMGKS
ncbi:MAG: DUF998 domain-containing protein [Candidatus Bathyarchaeia archaeon]